MTSKSCGCATKSCGCTTATCGCCEGARALTPMSTANRPGLDALRYRAGTHATFFETMKARLATMEVIAPGEDGQTFESFRPLAGLTTRESSDPAIALLDGWAVVGDVLTFYQERLANEGYLRTATERRSVLELARLVGYALRPGVAATVFLAYTLEDSQLLPVEIPAGARSQSIPGPDEQPQSFETSDPIVAQADWNNLEVRRHRPQDIRLDNVMLLDHIYVAGITANLKKGDQLLFMFGPAPTAGSENDVQPVIRTVADSTPQPDDKRTLVTLKPLPDFVAEALPLLVDFIETATPLVVPLDRSTPDGRMLLEAMKMLSSAYLGLPKTPDVWLENLPGAADEPAPILDPIFSVFADQVRAVTGVNTPPAAAPVTDPSKFIPHLLKPRMVQPASSLQLSRSLASTFKAGADVQPQLLVRFAPDLKDTLYTAWAHANVNQAASPLRSLSVFRVSAPVFGASAAKVPTYYAADDTQQPPKFLKGQLRPPADWLDWPLSDEEDNSLFLDQAHDDILPDSYVMIQSPEDRWSSSPMTRTVQRVVDAETRQRSAYGTSGKTTRLTFENDWWKTSDNSTIGQTIRGTLVYGQSELLSLSEEPVEADVNGQEIPLGRLYSELTSGRWVIFSGERSDIPGVTGVKTSELLMISGLRQEFDAALPGDAIHTTLLLATPTAFSYKRSTLSIYGNVVKATHGETRRETLGSGDGSVALQAFALKQPPLTFVPAPNPSGVDTTLEVYVNDVRWRAADTLAGAGPRDRVYITKTDDASVTTVISGTGDEGARFPTGVENIKAVYRNGIGRPGNVKAEQVSLLQSRPLGVKSVINPLRASGGADRESRDQARDNAPLAVMSLDRLVSVTDYADFTRTFAGIGKAAARRLTDGRRELVHITIAGADDIPIDPVSDLYRNLVLALQKYGDVSLPVQVDVRELLILVLSANLRIEADRLWDVVVADVRAALLDAFGFDRRALGQPALLCEAIAVMQNVPGVLFVDVDVFGGIPEIVADADGKRHLATLEDLTDAVETLTSGGAAGAASPSQRVDVNLADFEGGAIRPAQLAFFTPAVADTVTLNQLL
jgi:hypothetical protein